MTEWDATRHLGFGSATVLKKLVSVVFAVCCNGCSVGMFICRVPSHLGFGSAAVLNKLVRSWRALLQD